MAELRGRRGERVVTGVGPRGRPRVHQEKEGEREAGLEASWAGLGKAQQACWGAGTNVTVGSAQELLGKGCLYVPAATSRWL